ncbi:MAG TPA: hypothetical protein VF232_00125 [Gaiellaceae bacterium]
MKGSTITAKRSRSALTLLVAASTTALALTAISFASARGGSSPAAVGAHATTPSSLATQIARARIATAKYATNLGRAKADGYGIITRMIPSMGWHYMNPKVTGFDVRKPPILVYLRRGGVWQLGALEWVFPELPAKPPIQGARYGAFGAACHYVDGTFVVADAQSKCAQTSPETGAKFNFWHGPLVTLHIWLWYPNPSGLYSGTNPLVTPFDRG